MFSRNDIPRYASRTFVPRQPIVSRPMVSKYAGRCDKCRHAITVGTNILWRPGYVTHATDAACEAAKVATLARVESATPAAASVVDLAPIARFIQAARDRGLKYPKLRVLALDGRTELTLGLTVGGIAPGSVFVKVAGVYIGAVSPEGKPRGRDLTPELQSHLMTIAAAPAAAAKAYAVLMCRCSFCGLALTDEGSVEVGYGPVCAKHWGLPHAPKGTKAPSPVQTNDVAA